MKFDSSTLLRRKKYPIFLLCVILTTWYVFVDLVVNVDVDVYACVYARLYVS